MRVMLFRTEPVPGFLDDYAFLIKGLIDYYVATLDLNALRWAKDLQDTQDRLFWDDELGGYFYSQANAPNVIIRLKDDHDGAEPCGNSVAASNLLILSSYFEHLPYIDRVVKLFEVNAGSNPFSFVLPEMFSGLLLYDTFLTMLVVVGEYCAPVVCGLGRTIQLQDVWKTFSTRFPASTAMGSDCILDANLRQFGGIQHSATECYRISSQCRSLPLPNGVRKDRRPLSLKRETSSES